MEDLSRKRIALRVIELRTKNNLTQEQLADATQLSINTIKGIEDARFSVKTDILERVASCLGVRVDLI